MIPHCPKCKSRILQKSADGKVKIRTSIVVFGPNGTEVVCRRCGTDVPVQITLDEAIKKALDQPGPPLVVRKKIDSTDPQP